MRRTVEVKLLEVQAFGKLSLQCNGSVIASFPTRHVEELLGYLLLNQHLKHRREKLIGILWPNKDPAEARARFSTVLWRLRTLLDKIGAPSALYLETTRDWVSFMPERPPRLDVEQFEQFLTQAQFASDDIQHEQALSHALSLYRGELYEGIYADWCLVERERLARLYLRAMGQLMNCCIRRHDFAAAVDLGQAILDEDPLREEVHRAIMYCYQQMDQRAQAVEQFFQCAQQLRQELRIVPMPETVALYRQIVEDRLKEREASISDSLQTQLQDAFREFQQAGNKLNNLLSAVE
jgi:DNA-binding SARP family transcriptional activator